MNFGDVIAWLIVGAVVGYLAALLHEARDFGKAGNMAQGIAGAAVAGAVLPGFGIFGSPDLFSNVVSAGVGAVLVLVAAGLVRRV